MRNALFSTAISLFAAALLASCSTPTETHIIEVVDLPLKTTKLPDGGWHMTPLRVHARYMLDHAESTKEKRARIGDYYFVNWYDAQPAQRVELRMRYTQAKTGSKVLTKSVVYDKPRAQAGKRQEKFFYNGEDRSHRGDILSWCIELMVEGQVVSRKQSFLWE